ncbi:Protein fam49a [Nowakowskiella sp. JEL0407]|nr:Protein fam49a [Nowakowskiella sp. JEL0407]
MRGAVSDEDSFIDFPFNFNAFPTPQEQEIYNYTTDLLQSSKLYLDSLRTYSGCGDQIRRAISSPGKETEDAAWEALKPCVLKLKDFYEHSVRIEQALPKLLIFLCFGDVGKQLEANQATTKRLADIFHFISLFDELKMSNQHIQNDFSYYRRTLNKMKMSASAAHGIVVQDELANRMSLFYAHSSPMMKSLSDSTINLINSKSNGLYLENTTDCLSCIAAVCYNSISKGRVNDPALTEYCLRVLLTVIILYDRIDPKGVFVADSKIKVRPCVKVIQEFGGINSVKFLNFLKFNTIHFNDESTPKSTKQLFLQS